MDETIRIAIWGCDVQASFLKAAFDLIHPAGLQLVCFSKDEREGGEHKDGLPVKSADETSKMYQSGEVHAVILAVHHKYLAAESTKLALKGIMDIYYLPHYEYEKSIGEFSFDNLQRIDLTLPRLDYIEYHVADHCNLNCKGCMHLSNIATPRMSDPEQFERDMNRLRELFWGIERIRLMGGEPFLNDRLPEFIRIAREVFPDSDIHVVSNGLLIGPAYTHVLEEMRKYHVSLNVSLYPPILKLQDRIRSFCSLYKVRVLFTDPINVFRNTFDPSGGNDPAASYKACDVTQCTFLRDGTISNCITPYLLSEYSKMLEEDIRVPDNDIIDLYAPDITGIEILERLKKPIGTCRYCDPVHTNAFKWEIAGKDKAKLEDWLAEK